MVASRRLSRCAQHDALLSIHREIQWALGLADSMCCVCICCIGSRTLHWIHDVKSLLASKFLPVQIASKVQRCAIVIYAQITEPCT